MDRLARRPHRALWPTALAITALAAASRLSPSHTLGCSIAPGYSPLKAPKCEFRKPCCQKDTCGATDLGCRQTKTFPIFLIPRLELRGGLEQSRFLGRDPALEEINTALESGLHCGVDLQYVDTTEKIGQEEKIMFEVCTCLFRFKPRISILVVHLALRQQTNGNFAAAKDTHHL
jgi:hypothetical protein